MYVWAYPSIRQTQSIFNPFSRSTALEIVETRLVRHLIYKCGRLIHTFTKKKTPNATNSHLPTERQDMVEILHQRNVSAGP